MRTFTILANEYLDRNIQAYYHTDYVGHNNPGNPDYLNTLKNTFGDFSSERLNTACHELEVVLMRDIPQIFESLHCESLTVCVIPRAKAEYQPNQLLFKSTVKNVINRLGENYCDGTNYLKRYRDTKTTHLRNLKGNEGATPYPGITFDTCTISDNVKDKDILLIDDIYTKTINIDEDAIQALIESGAKSVTFYAVGRTRSH